MKTQYFSYSPEGGFDFHNSEQEAIKAATEHLNYEKYVAGSAGWSEEVDDICWGEIRQRVEKTWEKDRPEELDEDGHDEDGMDWGDFDRMEGHELMPKISQPPAQEGGR